MMLYVSLSGIRTAEKMLPGEMEAASQQEAETFLGLIVRAHRSKLLRDCDWTQIPDNNLDQTQRSAFAVYRQALRDVTEQSGFPNVIWPVAPTTHAGAGSEIGEQS